MRAGNGRGGVGGRNEGWKDVSGVEKRGFSVRPDRTGPFLKRILRERPEEGELAEVKVLRRDQEFC